MIEPRLSLLTLIHLNGVRLKDIAAACGVSVSAVSYWLKRGVPLVHIRAFTDVTKLTPAQVRPDVFVSAAQECVSAPIDPSSHADASASAPIRIHDSGEAA